MSAEIVMVNELIAQYRISEEVQQLFQIQNGVRTVEAEAFERIRRLAKFKREQAPCLEYQMIQPAPKRACATQEWSVGSQATMSSLGHGAFGRGCSTMTSAGSILHSGSAGASKSGSHGSILQSEMVLQEESGVLESEITESQIIASEPVAVRSSPPPEVLGSSEFQ
ncbi:AaceriADL148Cp [[Ashbya] aceris (nom. inval.)]|nr:AaceriADL148Cp [[Ashbya] aceris (nom. inval.)]